MSLHRLLIVTSRYPSLQRPMDGAFVEQIIAAFTRLGISCEVIHPIPVHLQNGSPSPDDEKPANGSADHVYRPRYLSLSSRKIGGLDLGRLTQKMFENAVWRVIRNRKLAFDAVYGHFLYLSGVAATRVAARLHKPSFVGVGESYLRQFDAEKIIRARQDFATATGFIAVSSANQRFLLTQLCLAPDRVSLFPNGIDTSLFHPRDRLAVRQRLHIPENDFVVAFMGYFDQRKGVLRVAEALHDVEHVGAIFIGDGPLQPEMSKIYLKAQVPHEQVPEVLAAADIFVLPTLAEGCSNALLEAMACGLPIVSSRGEFNDDILNDDVSIRVDPLNVGEIRNAIIALRDDVALRQRMAQAALRHAQGFDIHERTRCILDWMTQQIVNRRNSS